MLNSITKHELDTDMVAFQSYDYASTMIGKHKGAQAMLSEKLGHEVPYISCQGHRSNTVMGHSSAASSIVTSMCVKFWKHCMCSFPSSTKRHSVLTAQLQQVENALLLRNLSKTRWAARAESKHAVWASFECIIESLREIKQINPGTKTTSLADGLLKSLLRFDFACSIMFMKNVMCKTKLMTEKNAGRTINILDALVSLKGTITTLETMSECEVEMNNNIEAAI